ncbi:MAG: dinitrogenase iron-molybdenum cofactor biosynthesis protein [Chloroflexus aggregans]|uniref:Dinitrogenase iron-molybdenum cofactor biosynthesis protein n=1 Tax=Chloroflexus aggregans TaxID=152260 RepID=A0A2J6WVG6_9CHLR|nr:MAG: dinitrogenase iron-molybdenum cofactor biosynthesis protein [Chloroflexus aggregans]
MKIAFATDDHHTISPHLGRAQWYEVVTIEQGQVVNREVRPKGRHHHHGDEEHDHHHHHHRHDAHHWLVEAVSDCQMIVARGMGEPAFQGVQAAGIQAICTPLRTIDEAVQAYVNGTLTHHPERVHHRH